MSTNKTLKDRVIHALLFESIAMVFCAPVLSWLFDKPIFDAGALVLALALIAMVWNMIFNALFDRLQQSLGFSKTVAVRMLHALAFEAGLIVVAVALASWWFSISYWEAFLLDIGFILFFLPYTYLFNLGYDKLMEKKVNASLQQAN